MKASSRGHKAKEVDDLEEAEEELEEEDIVDDAGDKDADELEDEE